MAAQKPSPGPGVWGELEVDQVLPPPRHHRQRPPHTYLHQLRHGLQVAVVRSVDRAELPKADSSGQSLHHPHGKATLGTNLDDLVPNFQAALLGWRARCDQVDECEGHPPLLRRAGLVSFNTLRDTSPGCDW
jgi:hypothetical protein